MPSPRPMIGPNDKHLQAIGRIAVYWTLVEGVVEHIIWILASMEQFRGQSLTTHMGATTRLDTTRTLAHLLLGDTPLQARIEKCTNRIQNELAPKRNKIVHALWGPTGDPNVICITRMTARSRLKFEVVNMSLEDLEAFADEINEMHRELLDILFAIPVPPPSLGTPPLRA